MNQTSPSSAIDVGPAGPSTNELQLASTGSAGVSFAAHIEQAARESRKINSGMNLSSERKPLHTTGLLAGLLRRI